MDKRKTGKKYEKIARKYLLQRGWDIIQENYFFGHKEVDLIVRKKEELCFVEVKYRKDAAHGKGFEFVDKRKKSNIKSAAKGYMASNPRFKECSVTFGVVSITGEEIDFRRGFFSW